MRARAWAFGLGFAANLTACGGKTDDAAGQSGGVGGAGGTTASGGGSGGASIGGSGGGTTQACVVESMGALPSPAAPTALVSSVGIVATDTAFVLGYREQAGNELRAILQTLSDSGTANQAAVFELDGCATAAPTDGVSLAYRSGQGMFVASTPDCGKGAGAIFVPFDDQGTVQQASSPKNAAFSALDTTLRAVAPHQVAGNWEFVYTVTSDQPQVAELIVLEGTVFKSTIAHPFGPGPRVWISVATSPDVLSVLSADTAGTLDWLAGPNLGDAPQVTPAPSLPASTKGDLIAFGPRVAAAALLPTALHLSVGELTTGGFGVVSEHELPSAGALSFALATDAGDLFAALGHPGAIELQHVEGVTTSPQWQKAGVAKFDAAPLAQFDGEALAVAAARGRVAVVWTSSAKLTPPMPTGGWLIARCE